MGEKPHSRDKFKTDSSHSFKSITGSNLPAVSLRTLGLYVPDWKASQLPSCIDSTETREYGKYGTMESKAEQEFRGREVNTDASWGR